MSTQTLGARLPATVTSWMVGLDLEQLFAAKLAAYSASAKVICFIARFRLGTIEQIYQVFFKISLGFVKPDGNLACTLKLCKITYLI